MKKYTRKTVDKNHFHGLIIIFLSIITALLLAYLDVLAENKSLQNNQSFISPVASKVYAYEEATPSATPSPTATPTPQITERTARCTQNYPGITTKIKHHFGDEWVAAANLICRESSFNQHAVNQNGGACGLVQSYPCEKMNCDLEDADCQLRWGKAYMDRRYGGANEAWEFWKLNKWY